MIKILILTLLAQTYCYSEVKKVLIEDESGTYSKKFRYFRDDNLIMMKVSKDHEKNGKFDFNLYGLGPMKNDFFGYFITIQNKTISAVSTTAVFDGAKLFMDDLNGDKQIDVIQFTKEDKLIEAYTFTKGEITPVPTKFKPIDGRSFYTQDKKLINYINTLLK